MGCGASKKMTEDIQDIKKKEGNEKLTEPLPDNNPQDQINPVAETAEPMQDLNIVTETVETKPKKTKTSKKENKQKLNPLDLSEMPAYRSDNPNFQFKDGELSPILSPVNANSQTQVKKQEPIAIEPGPKKVVVRRQKTTPFNWGNQGIVEIKTICFKIKYSHLMKGFKMLKSKDNYQTTILSWTKNEEEDVLEFTMKDTAITNLRTGNSIELSTPEIQFQVDPDGRFVIYLKHK